MASADDVARTVDRVIDFVARERALTAWFSERMLDLATLRPGMRVVDVATGRGEPAARAAARGAEVVGIDANAEAIALGRATAPVNLELRVGDAAEPITGTFDVALCRWGLPFFPDPVAALRAMQGALVPGGTMVLAVWVTVPWTPGHRALRYAESAALVRDLEAAALRLVTEEEHDVAILEATSREEVTAWSAAFGGIGPATSDLRLVGRSRIVVARG